ncbi:vegetative cell wall protein gp1-like [Triticum dicoccoides]|uniref:vegetative cell wall protein gp1-like n=1 Tax=Triticum dicoccoides TaxID=85692 RepID=UPI0018916862|nr:vegetative cell wall protein gp1-like [Triticum dicoccoides]
MRNRVEPPNRADDMEPLLVSPPQTQSSLTCPGAPLPLVSLPPSIQSATPIPHPSIHPQPEPFSRCQIQSSSLPPRPGSLLPSPSRSPPPPPSSSLAPVPCSAEAAVGRSNFADGNGAGSATPERSILVDRDDYILASALPAAAAHLLPRAPQLQPHHGCVGDPDGPSRAGGRGLLGQGHRVPLPLPALRPPAGRPRSRPLPLPPRAQGHRRRARRSPGGALRHHRPRPVNHPPPHQEPRRHQAPRHLLLPPLLQAIQVRPELYGDSNARFFTYWTTDAYQETG